MGQGRNLPVTVVDLTESYREFWLRAQEEILVIGPELRDELPNTYENLMGECSYFSKMCAKGDVGGTFRWFYVFMKNTI